MSISRTVVDSTAECAQHGNGARCWFRQQKHCPEQKKPGPPPHQGILIVWCCLRELLEQAKPICCGSLLSSACLGQGVTRAECLGKFSGRRHVFRFFFFFFFLFRASLVAYGGSQARSPIGTTVAGLHHSHSDIRSELRLQPIPQLTAALDT